MLTYRSTTVWEDTQSICTDSYLCLERQMPSYFMDCIHFNSILACTFANKCFETISFLFFSSFAEFDFNFESDMSGSG